MISINENNLHLSYDESFYEKEKADCFFEELYKLNFKELTLKIGSRNYTPLRKVCAFADSGLNYNFSGTSVEGEKWTPLLLRLKEDVEMKVGFRFNYVLVNLYENGLAKIGAHMDNESELDPEAPIAAISFGAKRKLIFERKGFPSVTVPIEHGSLYLMNPPTNKVWKHSIPAEPEVKEPRISLTFRKIKIKSENFSKKRKLQDDGEDFTENDQLGQYLDKMNSEYDISTTPSTFFHLSDDVTCCVKEFNGNLRVDIRRYKYENKKRLPTKEGIVIFPLTWYYFCEKIYDFNFIYKDSSFIANNCLLALNLGDGLHLQHMDCAPKEFPCLKETFITLCRYEVEKLLELEENITKCLIEGLWINLLPRQISSMCQRYSSSTSNNDESLNAFIECLEVNMANEIKNVFHCQGCIVDSFSQLNHDCLYVSLKSKFNSLGWRAWLLLNIRDLAKDLNELPPLNVDVVKGLTMIEYEKLLFVEKSSDM